MSTNYEQMTVKQVNGRVVVDYAPQYTRFSLELIQRSDPEFFFIGVDGNVILIDNTVSYMITGFEDGNLLAEKIWELGK